MTKKEFTDEQIKQLLSSDLQELDIKCADCDKTLLKMVCSRKTEETQKLIINCPFCNGQSWVQELVGRYYQTAPDGLVLGNMEENDGLYELTMETNDA